jgi:hypothetical protein
MFVALKNWRERLKHRGDQSDDRLLVRAERALETDGDGSADLLRYFRAAALAPAITTSDSPSLAQLGPQFEHSEALSAAENLSIMASVEPGAAR